MCFVNEGEWNAEVQDESDTTAATKTRCDECYATIEAGEFVHKIYQQEQERCGTCENGFCDCPKDEGGDCVGGCQCEEPDYGESFDYQRCENCHKFLQSVEAAEIEAGCRIWEARPMLPMMIEDIGNGGIEEARKYFKKARVMFPELVKSRYLGRLWCKMFASDLVK